MNYTENYHLPQWEETDRIMRKDFNEAMANIESGFNAASTRIATAQNTADTARAEVAALYATGTYQGKFESIFIDIGFRPKVVLISKIYLGGEDPDGTDVVKTAASLFLDTKEAPTPAIEFRSEGFRVWPHANLINQYQKTYVFIAFR